MSARRRLANTNCSFPARSRYHSFQVSDVAERPVFMPSLKPARLVEEIAVSFVWHKGMAPSQKKKNVVELHAAAAKRGISPLLEVSSKSEEKLGQRLSAFNLKVELDEGG